MGINRRNGSDGNSDREYKGGGKWDLKRIAITNMEQFVINVGRRERTLLKTFLQAFRNMKLCAVAVLQQRDLKMIKIYTKVEFKKNKGRKIWKRYMCTVLAGK
jgi:hypothetical protein